MIAQIISSVVVLILTAILALLWKMTSKPKQFKGIPVAESNSIFGLTKNLLTGLDIHKIQSELSTKYGDFYQFHLFGVRFINVSDKRIIKDIMKNIDQKTFWVTDEGITQWGVKATHRKNTFNMITGKSWQLRRSSFKHAFTLTSLRHFDNVILGCVSKLSSIIEDYAKEGKVLAIDKLFGKMTVDIICEVAFDFKINALENSSLSEDMNDAVRDIMGNTWVTFLPYASVIEKYKLLFYNSFKKFRAGQKKYYVTNKILLDHLVKRDKEGTLPEDSLGKSFIEFSKLPGVTSEDVQSDIGVIFVAGHETTAHSLSFFVYSLARNPEVQKKAQEAVDNWIPDNSNSSAIPPYVEAVIKESMRKYPVAPRVERSVQNKEGYSLDVSKIPMLKDQSKIHLPKGTNVMIDIQSLHLSEANWGPDAKEFKPERWLDPSKPLLSSPSIYSGGSDNTEDISFMPFANGPRNCMGMNMALVEIRLTVVELLKKFHFEFVDESFRDELNFREFALAVRPKDEMPIKVTLRER